MKMKPKSTVHNTRALLYRRFTDIDKSATLKTVYVTSDNLKWIFDLDGKSFLPVTDTTGSTLISITASNAIRYIEMGAQPKYYKYFNEVVGWYTPSDITSETILGAKYANIGTIQTNRYYMVGSFDYMIKGSVEGTTTQFIKGNITPLTSFSIKHFNDEINLAQDDLVVIDGHLYSVENPSYDMKMQPRPFKVYFATLNNIL